MSVQRAYAQRNTNLTKIVPEFATRIENQGGPFFDMSGVGVYTLNLPNKFQNIGGIYYVDMSDIDTDGNLLDLSGQFVANYSGNGNGFDRLYNVNFAINAPLNPAYAPGLEFTIFFKNIPFDRLNEINIPLLSIGIINLNENGAPFPYIMSPPLPVLTAQGISNSVTFKSDGTYYNVVSSGPAGWVGIANLALLINVTNML